MINGINGRVSSGQGIQRKLMDIQRKLSQQKEVAIGLPASTGNAPDGTPIVQIGYWNEFGTKYIPERSFLRVPLRANQDEIAAIFRRLMQSVIAGELTLPQALDQIGAKGASISQEAISAGIDPPNAQSTIRRKKSSKPLIDTGAMRQAITWVVRDKEK